jgi:hypothetical protein
MAKKRGVRITIVVEDEALERFTRNVLMAIGFSRHELTVSPYPVGRGSAKDWVDQQYVAEVRKLRARPGENVGLVVGTDADELTLPARHSRLAESLTRAAVAARKTDERIVLWIPKWNVETWILLLTGDRHDENGVLRGEDRNYKHQAKKPDFAAVAGQFIDQYRAIRDGKPVPTLPSLHAAYVETQRLKL